MNTTFTTLFFFGVFGFFSLQSISCSNVASQGGQTSKSAWDKSNFTIVTMATASKEARWLIRNGGNLDASVDESIANDKAFGVLEAFNKLPSATKSRGIYIYSKTYAIPDTTEEQQLMTEHIGSLYKNAHWRKSESDLIEELKRACDENAIPLYVNLSANLFGEWKKIAAERPLR